MTLISKISRLRHPGVMRDFAWPADLSPFGRYNLIYGWNGTGKTTLSNLFRALELRKPPLGETTLVINNTAINGADFGQTTIPVRVFNRDFIADSVFPVGGGDVPPIFVLGKESAEKQAEVERLKGELSRAQDETQNSREEKHNAERSLDRHCIDRATVIRETLRSSGVNAYNNYDKARYKQRAERMNSEGDKENHLIDDATRERLMAQNRAARKSGISEIKYQIPDLQKLADGTEQLMQKTVVSAAIASLKDDPALASWTRQGLGLHQERHAEQCLYCEQPMPKGRILSLESHFSTEYEQLLRGLDEQIRHLESLVQATKQVALPNRAEFLEDLASDYDVAQAGFLQTIQTVNSFLGGLIEALRNKQKRLFEPVSLSVSVPAISISVAQSINDLVGKHNKACSEFDSLVKSAREKLESGFVAESLDDYKGLMANIGSVEQKITDLNNTTAQLVGKIKQLERDIIEHREPAEELNEDLHKYLGHAELQIEVKDTGYAITRNGVPAHSLSEGERTALSLLYFLKSLKDRRFEFEKGLVVLDDPVSSLDANALFLAFGFIRRCTENAGQVVILTHNFAMFRQVRHWFHHLKGQNKKDISQRPARFYMLECMITDQGRRSSICTLDPLLEEFESEYHYLFARIYRRSQNAGQAGLEANYIFPNMARRLLEAFLAFRRPRHAGELHQKLSGIKFDETRKLRILRFLHTHSHADAIGDPEHEPSVLGETAAVLNDLLELVRIEDPAHYDAMIALVTPPGPEEEVPA